MEVSPDFEIGHASFFQSEVGSLTGVDCVVTSPPYNIDKQYAKYCDKKPMRAYCEMLGRIWSRCYDAMNPGAVMFVNISELKGSIPKSGPHKGRLLSDIVHETVRRAGFDFIQRVIWVKSLFGRGHFTPSGGTKRFNNVWESVFVFAKPGPLKLDVMGIGVPYADKGNIGRYGDRDLRDRGDVWYIPYEEGRKLHACPFPVELPYRCIRTVKDCALVLDPFAGSGTTGAAANILGVKSLLFDPFVNVDVVAARLRTRYEIADSYEVFNDEHTRSGRSPGEGKQGQFDW